MRIGVIRPRLGMLALLKVRNALLMRWICLTFWPQLFQELASLQMLMLH